jgi:hypothetical protein
MASIILECPHCGAEKIGFQLVAEVAGTLPGARRARVMMLCSNCEEAVIGVFEVRASSAASYQQTMPMSSTVDPTKTGSWTLIKTYPQPQPSKCPPYTPDDLKRIFLQASNAFKRGDPDASGAMSRKVVDVSTQQLLGADSKKFNNIQGRIDELSKRGQLTEDLRQWAHEIRLGGNDAAHDTDPFTDPESEELLDFAELYLTYVYSLPLRLADRRARTASAKAKP